MKTIEEINKSFETYQSGVSLAVKATQETRDIMVSNANAITKAAEIIQKAVNRCK